MNTRKFDLEAAKKGAAVCTKDGNKVRILAFDAVNTFNAPIVALVKIFCGEYPHLFDIEGVIANDPAHELDLVMAPAKKIKTGYVKICYDDGKPMAFNQIKESPDDFILSSDHQFIAKIKWEE